MPSATVKSLLALCITCFLLAIAGCNNQPNDKSLTFINTVDAERLVQGEKKLLGLGTRSGTWVDARSETDYRAGHIPGAINLPYERVNTDHRLLKDYEVLIVYGNDYNDARANGMSKRLLALGYSDVRTLTGGLRAWKADGNAIEVGEADERSKY